MSAPRAHRPARQIGPNYSDLSAIAGSTRAARRAGTPDARIATITSTAATPANTIGSLSLTSYSWAPNKPDNANAPAVPTASPASAGVRPVLIVHWTMSADLAPNAIRMPISFVRWPTTYATTPYTPIAASRSATTPNAPTSSVSTRGAATAS